MLCFRGEDFVVGPECHVLEPLCFLDLDVADPLCELVDVGPITYGKLLLAILYGGDVVREEEEATRPVQAGVQVVVCRRGCTRSRLERSMLALRILGQ